MLFSFLLFSLFVLSVVLDGSRHPWDWPCSRCRDYDCHVCDEALKDCYRRFCHLSLSRFHCVALT